MRMNIVAGAILVAAIAVWAGEAGCKGHQGGGDGDGCSMGKELALTAEQKADLKALREEGREGMKAYGEKMREQRKALKEELKKDSPDDRTLDKLAQDAGDLATEFVNARIDHMLKVKKVLKPEQFAKLLQHEMMMGPGPGGPHESGKPGCGKGMGKGEGKGCEKSAGCAKGKGKNCDMSEGCCKGKAKSGCPHSGNQN